MPLKKLSVNKTSVFVVFREGSPHARSTLQITIRPGKSRRSDEEHIAMQGILAAVKRLQDLAE